MAIEERKFACGVFLDLRKALRPIYTCNFPCDFLLLTDVKEWINNEYSEYMFLYLNICVWFIRSHPSKGENRTRNRAKVASVNQPLDSVNHSLLLKKLDHYGIRGIAKKLFISYLNDRRQEFCSWTLVIPIIHP